jgi:hypothetical protein
MREDRTRLEQENANMEEALRKIQAGKKKWFNFIINVFINTFDKINLIENPWENDLILGDEIDFKFIINIFSFIKDLLDTSKARFKHYSLDQVTII